MTGPDEPHDTPQRATFLAPPGRYGEYDTAHFVILPVPYEKTTTYGKGTAHGPAAVIEASGQVEFYDEELRFEPYRAGIATAEPVITYAEDEAAARIFETAAAAILADGKRFIAIGGEHSISLGLVRAAARRCPSVGVLHFDAHADMRDEYEHTRYGHGTVMRRVFDGHVRIVQVGIRALSIEEAEFIDGQRVKAFLAADVLNRQGPDRLAWHDEVVAALPDEVYVSFDIDALDPSIAPGTGTPEPGGLLWYETLSLLKKVAARKRIVSADVVEVRPLPGNPVTEFTAARLIHKLIGYMAAGDAMISPRR